jgi:hypothetical protein
MTLNTRTTRALSSPRSVLSRLIEMPDLARTVRELPPQTFAALVHKVGVEDAGELVALATTQQLVQAFDEDLFTNDRPGKREVFDAPRFATWLEVLLEAGDAAAARRVTELDLEFVAFALSNLVLVVEEDTLRERFGEADEDEVWEVDKALESALSEDIDGYVLIARQYDGWDATLALLLALDRDHRAVFERLVDRLVRLGKPTVDDLSELSNVLTEGESLAEDVEAVREARRSEQGYVEPRAARSFLSLARKAPSQEEAGSGGRDPVTRIYFRDLGRSSKATPSAKGSPARDEVPALPAALERELADASAGDESSVLQVGAVRAKTFVMAEALRALNQTDPELFRTRMDELVYLTNVLVAGAEVEGERLRSQGAADVVLATVSYGAALELRGFDPGAESRAETKRIELSTHEFMRALRSATADLLFRRASYALVSGAAPSVPAAKQRGFLCSAEELEAALG